MRPNILLIYTDQQRFDTIRALGNGHIQTPNLDRLVGEGVAFTQATTPSPVCLVNRWRLHSGHPKYQAMRSDLQSQLANWFGVVNRRL